MKMIAFFILLFFLYPWHKNLWIYYHTYILSYISRRKYKSFGILLHQLYWKIKWQVPNAYNDICCYGYD